MRMIAVNTTPSSRCIRRSKWGRTWAEPPMARFTAVEFSTSLSTLSVSFSIIHVSASFMAVPIFSRHDSARTTSTMPLSPWLTKLPSAPNASNPIHPLLIVSTITSTAPCFSNSFRMIFDPLRAIPHTTSNATFFIWPSCLISLNRMGTAPAFTAFSSLSILIEHSRLSEKRIIFIICGFEPCTIGDCATFTMVSIAPPSSSKSNVDALPPERSLKYFSSFISLSVSPVLSSTLKNTSNGPFAATAVFTISSL
mmetsp:Transcript_50705/g.130784  ORF Transcript_50705/g.130784 Transcript_50705/m.130784 type:complete len:253 (-) Transcript_50705:172-930(-)